MTKETRDMAWIQMYDIVRLSRYYANLGSLHSKWQMGLQAVSLGASLAAIASLMEMVTEAMIVSGLLVGISAVIAATWNNPSRVAAIISASMKCRAIEIEAMKVWKDLESLEEDVAGRAWMDFARRLEEATTPVELAGVGFSNRQNRKAADEAREDLTLSMPGPPDTGLPEINVASSS